MTVRNYVVRAQCPDKEALWIGTFPATPESAPEEAAAFVRLYWPAPYTILECARSDSAGFIRIPPPTPINLTVTE